RWRRRARGPGPGRRETARIFREPASESQISGRVRVAPAQIGQVLQEREVEKPLRGAGAAFQLRPADARRAAAEREGDEVVLLFGEQQRRIAAEALRDAPAMGFDALVVG